MRKVKFSIITVCFNSGKTISTTIESIIKQKYHDFEYIIIDGGSKDSTMKIVEKYKKQFLDSKIPIIVISEKDRGIYDAMNKGTDLASGEYINFMNSDDSFNNVGVLQNLNDIIEQYQCPDIIIGNTNMIQENGLSYIHEPKKNGDEIFARMPFIHQSTFVKTKLIRERKFNIKYKICADYDFFLYAYLSGFSFLYSDILIANYSTTGLSSRNDKLLNAEKVEIRKTLFRDLKVSKKIKVSSCIYNIFYDARNVISKSIFLKRIFIKIKNNRE